MRQPVQPAIEMRNITIACFTCYKSSTIQLKPWDLNKNTSCPICNGKEAIIV